MATITFERIERASHWNKTVRERNPGVVKPRGIDYDFKVLIDGEHRATLCRDGHFYRIWEPVGGAAIYRPRADDDRYYRKDAITVGTQADFAQRIAALYDEGLIPTLADYAKRREERAAARERQKIAQAAQDRDDRRAAAAADLEDVVRKFQSLFTIEEFGDDKDFIAAMDAAAAVILRIETPIPETEETESAVLIVTDGGVKGQ